MTIKKDRTAEEDHELILCLCAIESCYDSTKLSSERVDKLVQQGLVERITLLELTDKGEKILNAALNRFA